MRKIAFIVASRDFRDEEYFIPREVFEKEGFQVETFSDRKGIIIGVNGGEGEAQMSLDELDPKEFFAVVFAGGPGAIKYLNNEKSYALIEKTIKEGVLLAAICISPVILAKAGVLKDHRATVWNSSMNKDPITILQEEGAIYEERDVVRDGKIITANGLRAAEEFAKKIVGD